MRPTCLTVEVPVPSLREDEREAPVTLQDRLRAKRENKPLPAPMGGDVDSTTFLDHVLGKGSVARWHHLSRPTFHAVRTTRYVPHVPTEEDVAKMFSWRKMEPDQLAAAVTRVQKQARESVCGTSLLFQTLHDAYDRHLPVSLAPEVLWYAICHEVAFTVKSKPDDYAHLFTTKPGEKQFIEVSVDHFRYEGPNDWAAGIQLFDGELRARVPDGIMDHVLPKFSTSTQESDVALLVAFMDAASPYYDYGMSTCCGIPRVRLEGVPDDWKTLVVKAQALSEVFSKDLGLYFEHLLPVLSTLSKAAHGEDVGVAFWKSMVKVNGGSGGPYVGGWLTTFWNYVSLAGGKTVPKDKSLYDWTKNRGMHGMHPSDFTSHVTKVDFVWDYFGTKFPMALVSGVVGVEQDAEGFLSPRLGFGVMERAKQVQG